MGNTRIHTLCIRTDTRIEHVEYEPEAFFQGTEVTLANSMDMKEFFLSETGISCDMLKRGVGDDNIVAEELFFLAHKRRWNCQGDCVIFAGRSLTEEEEDKLFAYLRMVRIQVLQREQKRPEEESRYWESIYDKDNANALVITPEGEFSPICLEERDAKGSLETYFDALSKEAYPVSAEGDNIATLNESLSRSQFQVALFYDKMASFMGGRRNPFAAWVTQDEYISGDLVILGQNCSGTLRVLSREELAVVMKLFHALRKYREEQE